MNAEIKSNAVETREFYLPATFQFDTEPGRLERFLVHLFTLRGSMERIEGEDYPARFYLPATPAVRPKRPTR